MPVVSVEIPKKDTEPKSDKGSIATKDFHEVDSIDKIVLHILANKYRTTFQSISMRMKLI